MQEFWAIVEIMGHQQIAGKVSEETIAGAAMLRVDVPEVEDQPQFTKFYSASAIYAITPTEERIARAAASSMRARPVELWRLNLTQPQLTEKITEDNDIEDMWINQDDDDIDDELGNYVRMANGEVVEVLADEIEPESGEPDIDDGGPAHQQRARNAAAKWANDMLNDPFVILDLETTGLNDNAEICQIGLLSSNGDVLMNTLVKPTEPIPTSSSNIHGITDDMAQDAPTFEVIYDEIIRHIADKTIVIFNAGFDTRILNQVCIRHGLASVLNDVDVIHCAMLKYADFRGDWNDYHGNFRWSKLAYAIDEFNIDLGDGKEHDAMTDCRITLALIEGMAAYAQPAPETDS